MTFTKPRRDLADHDSILITLDTFYKVAVSSRSTHRDQHGFHTVDQYCRKSHVGSRNSCSDCGTNFDFLHLQQQPQCDLFWKRWLESMLTVCRVMNDTTTCIVLTPLTENLSWDTLVDVHWSLLLDASAENTHEVVADK